MARLHQFLHSVISGYGVLGANVLYTLISIPLALRFLPKEEFGLWALAAQVCMYLTLVDFGLTASLTRILVDHKDKGSSGSYASVVKSGWFVMLIQAALVLGVGVALPFAFSAWLGVPPALEREFCVVLIWQAVTFSLTLGLGVFSQILDAHQKQYVGNYGRILQFAVSGVLLWAGFRSGMGVYALPLANMGGAITFLSLTIVASRHYGLLHRDLFTARVSYAAVREVFVLGRDIFMITAGSLLIMGTQTVLVGRTLGMEAAATWAVGTRVFFLVIQVISKTFDHSMPAFAEMLVRGEVERVRQRFMVFVSASAAISIVAAVSMVLLNAVFVKLWTGGRILWNVPNDMLLGGWLVVLAVAHCNGMFMLTTKKIHSMRYVYLLEGLLFILCAPFAIRHYGVAGMVACSIVLGIAVHGAYGMARVSDFLKVGIGVFLRVWILVMLRVLVVLVPLAGVLMLVKPWVPELVYFSISAVLLGVTGAFLMFRHGLGDDVRRELWGLFSRETRMRAGADTEQKGALE